MSKLLKNAVDCGIPNMSVNLFADIKDILALPEIPINRDHLTRVTKMNKHFQKNTKSKHFFNVFKLNESFEKVIKGELVKFKEGMYVANGNTRSESKRRLDNGTNKIGYDTTHPVVCVIDKITSEDIETDRMVDEYYSFDSQSATENSSDKIKGAIKLFGLQLTSPKAMRGAFGSALNNAYPGDNKDQYVEKVAYFKKELELIDKCGIFNTAEKDLEGSHLICASLITAKMYSTPALNRDKMIKMLESISRLEFRKLKCNEDKWNGITALIYTAVMPNKQFKAYDLDYHGSTKFASYDPVVSFMLYCMELSMSDSLRACDGGFKKANWKNKFQNDKLALEQLFGNPIFSYDND